MDVDRESGFKMYSLGIVVAAKARNSDMIKVWPVESLSLEKGEITESSRQLSATGVNQHGVSKKATITGGAVIEAKWVPDGHSNRETAPDVQPNETVKIYRFADTNDYYWTTLFREPELRRLETVRYVYSNQPSGLVAYDENTSYWLEFSTHDKRVRLHTSENDGEACTYDLEINTRLGSVELRDNVGNNILLESPQGKLTANIVNDVEINTSRMVINASQSITFNTPTIETNCSTSTINGDTHTENTASFVTNGLAVSGAGANGGAAATTFEGNIQVDGNVTATGSIIDSGGNTNHHTH